MRSTWKVKKTSKGQEVIVRRPPTNFILLSTHTPLYLFRPASICIYTTSSYLSIRMRDCDYHDETIPSLFPLYPNSLAGSKCIPCTLRRSRL